MSAAEAIVGHANNKANRRTTAKKLQSQVLTKLTKYKKPKNIAATVTTVITEFIPIPGVGTVVGWAESKIEGKIKENLHKRRLETANDDYGSMKFNVKEFSVKQLDTARHKAKRNLDLYNALQSGGNSGACEQAYNIAYRYFRLENRLDKLEAMAMTMIEIGEEVKRWCDETRNNMDDDKMIKNVLSAMEGSHKKCGRNCVTSANDSDSLISAGVASSLFAQFAQRQESVDLGDQDDFG